mgnify:CR=1 FL=1
MRRVILFSIMLFVSFAFLSAESHRTIKLKKDGTSVLTRVPVDYIDCINGRLVVFFESSYNGTCEISVFDRNSNPVLTDESFIQSCGNHVAPLESLQCGEYLVKIKTPTRTITVGVEID